MVPMNDGGFAIFYWGASYDTSSGSVVWNGTHNFLQRFDSNNVAQGERIDLGAAFTEIIRSEQLTDGTVVQLYVAYSGYPSYSYELVARTLDAQAGTFSGAVPVYNLYDGSHGPTGTENIVNSSAAPRFDLVQMADGSLMITYVTEHVEQSYDANGNVINETYTYSVMAQQFTTDMVALNPAFVVATGLELNAPYNLDVTALAGGGAVVTWDIFDASTSDRDVYSVTLLGFSDGTTGNDTINGTAATDWIDALSGNDRVYGGGGADLLAGNLGHDSLYGGAGNDRLEGGAGNDLLDGGTQDDSLYGGAGNDTLLSGAGNDVFDGGDGVDTFRFTGTAGGIVSLAVSEAQDTHFGLDRFVNIENLWGVAGNDTLVGSTGNNLLRGMDGNDRLVGLAGNDRLLGNDGSDVLIGGAGRDTFVFSSITDSGATVGAADRITDFTSGEDRLQMQALHLSWIGATAFSHTAGELRGTVSGSDFLVQADLNGDGVSDLSIVLQGCAGIAAGDLLL